MNLLLWLLAVIFAVACDADEPLDMTDNDIARQDAGATDTTDVTVLPDIPLHQEDADDRTDVARPDTNSGYLARPDRSTYICDESQSRIEYPPIKELFEVPDTRYSRAPWTAREFVSSSRQSGAYAATSVLPALSHPEPSDRRYSFYARDGESIKLHAALWSSRINLNSESAANLGITGTVLVDYEPVEAHFELWDSDRNTVLQQSTATGVRFPVNTNVVIIDVTIPAEAFPEKRAYELGIFFKFGQPGAGHVSISRRMFTYYGGLSRASHPCFPVQTKLERTQEELAIMTSVQQLARTFVFPEGETDETISSMHRVGPGETVAMNYFMATSSHSTQRPAVLQPLLDGQPLGEPIYLEQQTHSGIRGETTLRGGLEVALPDEPGIYEFTIAGFEDAHLQVETHEGRRYDDVFGHLPRTTSNSVWFEVKASQ